MRYGGITLILFLMLLVMVFDWRCNCECNDPEPAKCVCNCIAPVVKPDMGPDVFIMRLAEQEPDAGVPHE